MSVDSVQREEPVVGDLSEEDEDKNVEEAFKNETNSLVNPTAAGVSSRKTRVAGDSPSTQQRPGVHEEGNKMRAAAELSHQLNTCTEYSQLEAIVFDKRLRWTPANVKVAFEALVRISLGRQLPIFHEKGSMSDGAYDVLSQSQTPLLLLAKLDPEEVENLKYIGAVLLANALEILPSLQMSHVAAILQAMGLLGLMCDDAVMLDLVHHMLGTLHHCSPEDLVHVLVGIAMLDYQPTESVLEKLEKRVAELESNFGDDSQGALLWSFSRLGREADVHKAREKTHKPSPKRANRKSSSPGGSSKRSEAMPAWKNPFFTDKVRFKRLFLHSEELRQAFHPLYKKSPLMLSHKTALPPKRIYDPTNQGTSEILALNRRPPFSLRFTQPWVAANMQRAIEHKEKVKATTKPLLKGEGENHFRRERMKNVHRRFIAEDEHLTLNPDQSQKDKELCDKLDKIKARYDSAMRNWRSEAYKEDAGLRLLEKRLLQGIEVRRRQLEEAIEEKDRGVLRSPHTALDDDDDPAAAKLLSTTTDGGQADNIFVIKVLWARFPKNLFSPSLCTPPETVWTPPSRQYLELLVDGVSTQMRTAAVSWAPEVEFFDSFCFSHSGADAKIRVVWKYADAQSDETVVGGTADLEWKKVELGPENTEQMLTLDILKENETERVTEVMSEHHKLHHYPSEKVGTCSILLSYEPPTKFDIVKLPYDGLIPPHETYIERCQRHLQREIKFAERQLKEAETTVEAVQAQRWHHMDALQEQRDEMIQAIILNRRVFGAHYAHPLESFGFEDGSDALGRVPAGRPKTSGSEIGLSPKAPKGTKKRGLASYTQPLNYYAHTSDNKTECLSIGVFDAADSPQKASPKVGASGQNSRHALTTPRLSTTTTDAEGQRAGREQATPWVEERWEVAGSDWNQRPPSSRSRHSSSHGSVLPSQMQTFHESRNATARPRASQEKMELKQIIQAYGDFDVTPTPQQSRIGPNVIRSVVGIETHFPGSAQMTEKFLEDSSKPWETFGHKEQWNERAPFALHDSDKTSDSVPPNSAHMLKGQGLLRNYLRAREINIAKKAAGHTRDLNWEPGPEVLPKNAIERKWRWDAQPVYKHSPYQAGRSCGQDHDSTMEKTPVKIFKYKNHITHVSAAEIPTWPRGSPRRASGAPSCYPSCGSTSDFDAARTPTSATIKRNRGTPFSHAGTPKEGMTPRPATTSRDNIGMSQKVGASSKDALSTIARTPSATTTKEGFTAWIPNGTLKRTTSGKDHTGQDVGGVRPTTAPAPAGSMPEAVPVKSSAMKTPSTERKISTPWIPNGALGRSPSGPARAMMKGVGKPGRTASLKGPEESYGEEEKIPEIIEATET